MFSSRRQFSVFVFCFGFSVSFKRSSNQSSNKNQPNRPRQQVVSTASRKISKMNQPHRQGARPNNNSRPGTPRGLLRRTGPVRGNPQPSLRSVGANQIRRRRQAGLLAKPSSQRTNQRLPRRRPAQNIQNGQRQAPNGVRKQVVTALRPTGRNQTNGLRNLTVPGENRTTGKLAFAPNLATQTAGRKLQVSNFNDSVTDKDLYVSHLTNSSKRTKC